MTMKIDHLYVVECQDTVDGMVAGPLSVCLSIYEDDDADAICWMNPDLSDEEKRELAEELAEGFNAIQKFKAKFDE